MIEESKNKFSEKKEIVAGFALISLISGLALFNPSLTGNVIIQSTTKTNPLSVLGVILILCSIVLCIYLFSRR